MELADLIDRISKLSTEDRFYILKEMLRDENLEISQLIVAKVSQLEQFKVDAKRDIVKVAEAGMELGEKEMRSLTKIKGNTRKKDDSFKLAMVRCLLDAGAYKGSKYGDQMRSADFSSVDDDWYEWAWQPKTKVEDNKG